MSYIDIATTCACYGFDPYSRAQVSHKISCEFMENYEVKPNNPMLLEAKMNKFEENYAYMSCELTEMNTG